MRLIPDKNKPAGEIRPAYFLKAFGRSIEDMRIVSFGRCNFHCPYCKRDGQYVDEQGNIITSREFTDQEVFEELVGALNDGQRIRLSGGDPCVYPKESLKIALWARGRGQKISIAHNGSSPSFVKMMLPYLEYAAIDLKAAYGREFNRRAGLKNGSGQKMLENSLQVQRILSENDVLVDVRTCVFAETIFDDLKEMAREISNSGELENKFWTIRQYKPVTGINWQPLPLERVLEYTQLISKKFPKLKIGLRAKWEPNGFKYWLAGRELFDEREVVNQKDFVIIPSYRKEFIFAK